MAYNVDLGKWSCYDEIDWQPKHTFFFTNLENEGAWCMEASFILNMSLTGERNFCLCSTEGKMSGNI